MEHQTTLPTVPQLAYLVALHKLSSPAGTATRAILCRGLSERPQQRDNGQHDNHEAHANNERNRFKNAIHNMPSRVFHSLTFGGSL
jgi:hypothetical protein